MNRSAFFSSARNALGALDQAQVDGFTAILDEAEKRSTPINDLAYMLATAWWETGKTMQPVREAFYISTNFDRAERWRKKHLRYYPFYGRGLVQLTWETNYRKASKKFGIDFVKQPDRVMEPTIAVAIMFDGMDEGWFTQKALDDYVDDIDESDAEDLREFIAARRIINGTDKATTIGRLGLTFEKALKAGDYRAIETGPAQPAQKPPETPPVVTGKQAGLTAVVAAIAGAIILGWEKVSAWVTALFN